MTRELVQSLGGGPGVMLSGVKTDSNSPIDRFPGRVVLLHS